MIEGCTLIKGFIDPMFANQIFKKMVDELPWQQPKIKIFGKSVAIPRLQVLVAASDVNQSYQYSGIDMCPIFFSGIMQELKIMVEGRMGMNFNTALVNYYRNGNDSVSWHSDDESLLGEHPVIVSLSLGSSRHFHFRKKSNHLEKVKYILENGDLFIMGPNVQDSYHHAILKEKNVGGGRINITFRNVV